MADLRHTQAKQSLTGVWHGLYSYPRYLEPVYFVATLIHGGTMVSGSIQEAEVGRHGAPLSYFAYVSGSKHENAVTFTKTYDGSGGRDHAVQYDGLINGDATEIEGTWSIQNDWGGRFLMIRSPGATETVARQAYAKV
jgi:hypothetical protein